MADWVALIRSLSRYSNLDTTSAMHPTSQARCPHLAKARFGRTRKPKLHATTATATSSGREDSTRRHTLKTRESGRSLREISEYSHAVA